MMLLDGYTLMHEHIAIDLSILKGNEDACKIQYQETLDEFLELYSYGVRNIIDVTTPDMGRDIRMIKQMEKDSGIRIICSTGFYKEPFLNSYVDSMNVDNITEFFLEEIIEGVEHSGVKASLIGEIGTSMNHFTSNEKKIFQAAAQASIKTNTPISTHTTHGTYALEQVDYLLSLGVSNENIIIGHTPLSHDINYICSVLDKGVYIAFDTIGKISYTSDKELIDMLLELERQQRTSQIVLSLDLSRKSHLKAFRGHGYTYLFTDFLVKLIDQGMCKKTIEQMLIKNPQNIFNKGVIVNKTKKL